LKDIFDDPLLAFRRANELLQDDEMVLNRYGKSLYRMSLKEKDQEEIHRYCIEILSRE
jgi:hypothetical protein